MICKKLCILLCFFNFQKWQTKREKKYSCIFTYFSIIIQHRESVWCIQLLQPVKAAWNAEHLQTKPVCSLMKQLKLHFTRQNVQIPFGQRLCSVCTLRLVSTECTLYRNCKHAQKDAEKRASAFAFIPLFHLRYQKRTQKRSVHPWKNSTDLLIWYYFHSFGWFNWINMVFGFFSPLFIFPIKNWWIKSVIFITFASIS